MPKRKSPARPTKKKIAKAKPVAKKPQQKRSGAPLPPKAKKPAEPCPEEYTEYLERYELYGEGRPHLSPAEFDRLDDEMLDLLALEVEQGTLSDEQIVRLQELEYLLLDSEA